MPEYTKIPEKYIEDYDSYFEVDRLKNLFSGDIFVAMRTHPVYFMWYGHGIKLRADQIYEIDQMLKKQKVITISARQRGKTFIRQVFIYWASFYNKYPQGFDRTTKTIIISHTDDEAQRYISEIEKMVEIGDERIYKLFKGVSKYKSYFSKTLPRKNDGRIGTPKRNTSQTAFKSDSGWCVIQAFPPTNRARGKPASILILDEVSSWNEYTGDDKDVYYSIINPMKNTSPNCKIFPTSTPKRPAGLFYDLCPIDGRDTGYEMIWIPYFEVKDEFYRKNCEADKEQYIKDGEYDRFRQEYLAEFIAVGETFFLKDEHIDKVFNEDYDMIVKSNLHTFAGVDFGGSRNSHSVITVVYYDKDNDKIYRLYHLKYGIAKDSTLVEDILEINKRFNVQKWFIDSQGAGSTTYANLEEKLGGNKLIEIVFAKSKRDMYNLFRIACFRNKIKSYRDINLEREFNAFTPDYKAMKGETDDMLDSFVLPCYYIINDNEDDYYSNFTKTPNNSTTNNIDTVSIRNIWNKQKEVKRKW